MDFDFPPPYDHEVPYRIGKARQELSPEGLEVLERIMAAFAGPEPVEPPEAIVAAMALLPRTDQSVLVPNYKAPGVPSYASAPFWAMAP